jgi:uncharacterized membrane protein YraQ (UPF0718 family)
MTANLLEATRWFVVMTAELVVLFLALSFLIGLLQAWVPEEKVRLVFEKRSPVGAYVGGASLGERGTASLTRSSLGPGPRRKFTLTT